MSCLHIQGIRRTGDGAPLSFSGPTNRVAQMRANAESSNPSVRAAAAGNPFTPYDLLNRLAEDEDRTVRMWVARNPKAPVSALWLLAHDPDQQVRGFVAWNPDVTMNLLKFLSEDKDEVVAKLAQTVIDNVSGVVLQ